MSAAECSRAEELLSARLDRPLSPEESAELEPHLAACPECRRLADEYPRLASGLEAAFRAAPLVARPAPRRRPAAPWLRLAAAAALLAAAGLGLYLAARARIGAPPPVPGHPEFISLEGGTVVIRRPAARAEFLGAREDTDEVIQLTEGEIEVHAVRAVPGRRAVRVETPLGTVETLGTVFTVKLVPQREEREGGSRMRSRKVLPLAAALLLVGVIQGRVLVRGELGEAEVRAGENAEVGPDKIVVKGADRIIKGKVVKVAQKDGRVLVTISVGTADGVREGFTFTCPARARGGKVLSVEKNAAVVEMGSLAAAVPMPQAGDAVETKLTTVLAEAPAVEDETRPKVVLVEPPAAVEGLELTLAEKEHVYKYKVWVGKDGKRIRLRGQPPREGAIPEGAKQEERERRDKRLTATLKNVSDKHVVLPFASYGTYLYLRELKTCAADAAGKAVLEREFKVHRAGGPGGEQPKDPPACVTVLKPGQSLDARIHGTYRLNFPAEGKYKLWVELEVKESREVLPAVKTWAGRLKSNAVEWEYKKRLYGPGRDPKPPRKPPAKTEVF